MDLTAEVNTLLKENETPLLRYACRVLRDADLARDMVQEAFVQFVRHRRQGKEINNPSAWLYRVTRNRCLDHLKSKKTKMEIPVDQDLDIANFAGADPGPDQALARSDELAFVRKALAGVAPRDREVLILKMEHEKSYKEIADIMNLSVSNVGFILHQTVKKITKDVQSALSGGDQR